MSTTPHFAGELWKIAFLGMGKHNVPRVTQHQVEVTSNTGTGFPAGANPSKVQAVTPPGTAKVQSPVPIAGGKSKGTQFKPNVITTPTANYGGVV